MDIEYLIYDLTNEYNDVNDYYFSGYKNNEFLRIHRTLISKINKKKENTINAHEKRIMEATIDYILAISSYYSALDLHGERDTYQSMVEKHGKSVISKLEYALKKLNEGKKRLNPTEDGGSIDFLNKAISETSTELDKIRGYERSVYPNNVATSDIINKLGTLKAKCIKLKKINKILSQSVMVGIIFLILWIFTINPIFYFLFASIMGINMSLSDYGSSTFDPYGALIGFPIGFIFAPLLILNWGVKKDRDKTIESINSEYKKLRN